MKSMTIHGVDEQLANLIRAKAQAEGLSINKTIKQILETALGIKPPPCKKNIHYFKEFCGIWTDADLKTFEAATSDTRAVDPEDWR